jgi:hypothetical protein
MEWNNDEEEEEEYEINPGGYFMKWGQKQDDEDEFCNRECYEFNEKFPEDLDDKCCMHCIMYLTLNCPHINDFIDDIEELDPD